MATPGGGKEGALSPLAGRCWGKRKGFPGWGQCGKQTPRRFRLKQAGRKEGPTKWRGKRGSCMARKALGSAPW